MPHSPPAPLPPSSSSARAPLLSAQSVYKTYRLGRVAVPVLRGASISVGKGEWVAILGASGSGKSTLLHLLAGLDRPTKAEADAKPGVRCVGCRYERAGLASVTPCPECGSVATATTAKDMDPRRGERGEKGGRNAAGPVTNRVIYNGRALSELSGAELDRYRNTQVGFVFQFYHLLPELNVVENVALGAMVRYGRLGYMARAGAVKKGAAALLESFGLGHRLDHRPAELSGGERQRVAIARALVNDPPVLLADEPTGNLDRETGKGILDAMVAHRAQSGRTMVLVTHDQEVAARADRIVRLRDGKVVEA